MTVSSGASLDLNGFAVPSHTLTISGAGAAGLGALTNSSTSSTASWAGPVALAANTTMDWAGNTTLTGVVSGSLTLTKAGAGTLVLAGANTYGSTTISTGTLQIGNGGTTGSMGTGSIVNNATLVVNRSSSTTISPTVSGTGTLVSALGAVTLSDYTGTGSVNVQSGILTMSPSIGGRNAPASTLKLKSYTLASGTALDLSNHDVIIGNTTVSQVTSDWLNSFATSNSAGIISSTAAADSAFYVPLDASALSLTSFNSVSITESNSVVLWYRVIGDVDLNGIVNSDDYSVVAGNFSNSTPGLADIFASWSMGDADLNGVVDADDFSVIAGNFGLSITGSGLLPLGVLAPVPEPSTLLFLVGEC